MVIILALSIWLLFWPKKKTMDGLNVQLQHAQADLAKAKKNAEQLNDWRAKMRKKEVRYKTVMKALPEKQEIPSLLAGVSQAGKDAGLEFLLFTPKKENAKEFYAEIPVDISVSGNYHQVATFFDKVSSLPRIVNIRNIKMTPQKSTSSGAADLTTTCQAVTYQFIEVKAGQTQQRGRRGRRK
ncbi:MAG: type 4a pilus biogenesis protein PilO [Desulfobacteraceae bacterium]